MHSITYTRFAGTKRSHVRVALRVADSNPLMAVSSSVLRDAARLSGRMWHYNRSYVYSFKHIHSIGQMTNHNTAQNTMLPVSVCLNPTVRCSPSITGNVAQVGGDLAPLFRLIVTGAPGCDPFDSGVAIFDETILHSFRRDRVHQLGNGGCDHL